VYIRIFSRRKNALLYCSQVQCRGSKQCLDQSTNWLINACRLIKKLIIDISRQCSLSKCRSRLSKAAPTA